MNDERVLDIASMGVVGATLLGWLPHIAAILSIIWMLIRIYETETVGRMLGRKPETKDNADED